MGVENHGKSVNRSDSAPNLTNFSQYRQEPKYSIRGKWKIIKHNDYIPAANKYDIRELITSTSKFRQLSRPCGFATAPRFTINKEDAVTKGPGQYDLKLSTIKKQDISFGKSQRPDITGRPKAGPGPGQYDTRGRNKCAELTLSDVTCKFAGRTGWFYDNPESTRKPGPGHYTVQHDITELKVASDMKIGTSLRPTIESHLGVNSNAPTVGPGHYKHLELLGGAKVTPYDNPPKYSFTSASVLKNTKPKDDPELILQATQFPQGRH